MRYSLLSALLALTIIAVSVSHWRVSMENRDLRESFELVREQQRIEVKNPKNAYVRHVPALEPDVWKFRVYLPPGHYRFTTTSDRRDDNGATFISPGESFLVSCHVSVADGTAIWQLPSGQMHTSYPGNSRKLKPATGHVGEQFEFAEHRAMFVVLKVPLVGGETGIFSRIRRPVL